MKANEIISKRRNELGYTDMEMANLTGTTVSQYCDIEWYEHEVLLQANLSVIKLICKVLQIDIFYLFNLKCSFCEKHQLFNKIYLMPRNEIIKTVRQELKISHEKLGNKVGFYKEAIEEMERNENYLEGWGFIHIKKLSKILNIPIQILLKVKCNKCNR